MGVGLDGLQGRAEQLRGKGNIRVLPIPAVRHDAVPNRMMAQTLSSRLRRKARTNSRFRADPVANCTQERHRDGAPPVIQHLIFSQVITENGQPCTPVAYINETAHGLRCHIWPDTCFRRALWADRTTINVEMSPSIDISRIGQPGWEHGSQTMILVAVLKLRSDFRNWLFRAQRNHGLNGEGFQRVPARLPCFGAPFWKQHGDLADE